MCLVYWPSNLLLYLIVGLGVEMKSVILQHPVQWFLQIYLLWFYPIQRPILPSIKISHQIVNSFFKNFLISLLPKWCGAIFWSRLETFHLFPRGEQVHLDCISQHHIQISGQKYLYQTIDSLKAAAHCRRGQQPNLWRASPHNLRIKKWPRITRCGVIFSDGRFPM